MLSCKKKNCLIAIESSCDETGICIMSLSGEIIYENLKSQISIHQKYGGVVPNIASKMHTQNIQLIMNDIVEKKILNSVNIKYVASTNGPGLIGCLILGTMFAKGIAISMSVPFIPINHLIGHIYSVNIKKKKKIDPSFVILLSGGHSMFIFKNKDQFETIGRTIDDSIGEAFDKIAKILGFKYPGGVEIEKNALKFSKKKHNIINFPLPLAKEENANLSLSGLKTAVLRHCVKKLSENGFKIKNNNKIKSLLTENEKIEISYSFQESVRKILEIKTKKSIQIIKSKNFEIKNIILCGGVAANKIILKTIKKIGKENNIKVYCPNLHYCSDNGTMIAEAALNIVKETKNSKKIFNNHLNSDVFSRNHYYDDTQTFPLFD